jgi:FMN-dependent NADH-azoreductase
MSTLLHVAASPRGAKSESLGLAEALLAGAREGDANLGVETFDLWDGTLPEFGPDAAAAKMAVFAGADPQGAEAAAWVAAKQTFERFAAADKYVFSVPMWNHGVPYILKQFIDVVSQPGMVFAFDPESGYRGLLGGRRAAVIYTSAVYGPDRGLEFGSDFQSTYLSDWLRWAGINDVLEVHFRHNLVANDVEERRHAAMVAAREAGLKLAAW